jgi:hypothetical protein
MLKGCLGEIGESMSFLSSLLLLLLLLLLLFKFVFIASGIFVFFILSSN